MQTINRLKDGSPLNTKLCNSSFKNIFGKVKHSCQAKFIDSSTGLPDRRSEHSIKPVSLKPFPLRKD